MGEVMLKKVIVFLCLVIVLSACSFNSGRVRLLNYDLGTTLFGNVPESITVTKGDTLYSISKRYNVPLRDLITTNNLTPPYTLKIGQVIRIPSAKYHTVVKGDTLYNISKRYDVDMAALSNLNDLEAPYTLSLGQKLLLPGTLNSPNEYIVESDDVYSNDVTYKESQEDETGTIWIMPTQTAKKSVGTSKTNVKKASSSAKKSTTTAAKKKTTYKKTAAKTKTKKTSAKATKVSARKSKFLWPVQGKVISKFGSLGNGRNNDGINIQAAQGATVRAADAGTIVYAGNELKGFGNLILVKHSGGWITAYAHNQKLLVKKGQKVKRGEKIATVGNTGGVSSPQLHFEVRAGKKAVNPLNYL